MENSALELYLASLTSRESQRAIRSRLNLVADAWGFKNAEECDWSVLTMEKVLELIEQLKVRPSSEEKTLKKKGSQVSEYGLQATSINAILSAVKGIANYAALQHLISENEVWRISKIKALRVHREPKGHSISSTETKRTLKFLTKSEAPEDVRDGCILAIMIGCGLRRAEVPLITPQDIDFREMNIRIVGKGNKERYVYFGSELKAIIQKWLAIRGKGEGYLFGRFRRTKSGRLRVYAKEPMGLTTIWKIVKENFKDTTPHDCRRTFITRLLEDGIDLATVQKFAGHSNPGVTALYDRRDESRMKEIAKNIRI